MCFHWQIWKNSPGECGTKGIRAKTGPRSCDWWILQRLAQSACRSGGSNGNLTAVFTAGTIIECHSSRTDPVDELKHMDALTALIQIIPPPTPPVYSGCDSDWSAIERILEMRLPADFKKLVSVYGTGCFLQFLYPLSPFAPFDTSLNLLSVETKQRVSYYRSGRDEFPQYVPNFPAYPEKSGLFPWGTTANGDTLFWLRRGQPENWPTIVFDSKYSKEKCDRFDMTATEFLYRLFSGKIEPKAFSEGLLTMERLFAPYSKRK